jgi:hypothetical protein
VPAGQVLCSVEAFEAAACLGSGGVLRVPTNGDPAVTAADHTATMNLALTPTETGWIGLTKGSETGETTAPSPHYAFFTAPLGSGSPVTKASYPVRLVIRDNDPFDPLSSALTSAFGKFAISAGQPTTTSLATTPSAANTRTLLIRAAHAPVHALAISLTKHRVVYAVDKHIYNGAEVLSRHLSKTGRVGKTSKLLSAPSAMVDLASSASTVVSVTSVGTDKHSFHEIMHVVDGKHRWTVNNGSDPQVAGHYVLYTHMTRDHLFTRLFNAATGRNVTMPASLSVASTPNLLVYQALDGSVRARPIAGGKSRKLFGVPAGVQPSNFAPVFAKSGFVAATYEVDSEEGDHHRDVEVYRKLAAGSATHTFKVTPGAFYNGVDGQGLLSLGNGFTTIRLFKTGRTRTVLKTSFFHQAEITFPSQVGVLGNRVAWIDGTGQAHIGNWR